MTAHTSLGDKSYIDSAMSVRRSSAQSAMNVNPPATGRQAKILSPFSILLVICACSQPASAKDDWDKYDGPSQLGHKVTWEAQAAEAKKQAQAIERISALCHGEALVREHQQGVNRFDPLTYDINLKLCMKRRANEPAR